MYKLKNFDQRSKGIIFAGCSFTWGQGLNYYSNLDTIIEPLPDQFVQKDLTYSHIEYIKSHRYPRLVANYFNSFELVQLQNGGSNQSTINYFETLLTNQNIHQSVDNFGLDTRPVNVSEISYIVFQITQWWRDEVLLPFNKVKIKFSFQDTMFNQNAKNTLQNYMKISNKSLEQVLYELKLSSITDVKTWLKKYEEQGVKVLILIWPNDYKDVIENDDWIIDRLVAIDYKEQKYTNIEDLMNHNKGLTINNDFEHFDICPQDHHPSIKCHQILADSIISRIKQDEQRI